LAGRERRVSKKSIAAGLGVGMTSPIAAWVLFQGCGGQFQPAKSRSAAHYSLNARLLHAILPVRFQGKDYFGALAIRGASRCAIRYGRLLGHLHAYEAGEQAGPVKDFLASRIWANLPLRVDS